MNKKALLKLADHIDEAGDEKFDLKTYGRREEGPYALGEAEVVDIEHLCGTVGCVAGFQNSMANQKILKSFGITPKMFSTLPIGPKGPELPQDVRKALRLLSNQTAARLDLGLSKDQAHELFTPPWSWHDRRTIWGKDPYSAKSQRAARLLRDIAFGRKTFKCDDKTSSYYKVFVAGLSNG